MKRQKNNLMETDDPRELHRRKLRQASPFKRQVYFALENLRHAHLPAKILGITLFVLIVANAVMVFIASQADLDPNLVRFFIGFYTFSTVCFGIEYFLRLWIADIAYADYTPGYARLRYVCSLMGIIDMLAFLPPVIAWFLPATPALLNTINVLRLVRLVKVSRYMRGLQTIGRVFRKRKREIIASFLVILLLVVVSSMLLFEAERYAQPDKFTSIFVGVYWAVTTITSTGFGDLVPITPIGRFIGSIVMLLSIALVAIPGGIFSAGFVTEFRTLDEHQRESSYESEIDDPDFHEGENILDFSDDDDEYSDDDAADDNSNSTGGYGEEHR